MRLYIADDNAFANGPLFRESRFKRGSSPPSPPLVSPLLSRHGGWTSDGTQTPGTVARVSSDLRDFSPSPPLPSASFIFPPSPLPFFPLSPFSVSSPHLTRITCPVAYSRRYFGPSARSAIRSMSPATKAFCSGRRMLVAPINSSSNSRRRSPKKAAP